MLNAPLTICCTFDWPAPAMELLHREASAHRLVSGAAEISNADIIFGQCEPEQILAAPHLLWMQIPSAGYTPYDNAPIRAALRARDILFTNSSHVYDEPCAQHALAMMLALARQLPQCLERQMTARDWKNEQHRQNSYLLNEQTVLLLGLGAIGRRLVELLQPLGMKIFALRRRQQSEANVEVISESELPRVLVLADHVVNVLPENAATRGLMNAARFAQMKPGAKFYNIGRGATVEQDALLQVLSTGHLGAAYLDVTDPEPLPPQHPLWSAPNCFITPHAAGGHANEHLRLVRHFVENLRRFESGQPLQDRILQ